LADEKEGLNHDTTDRNSNISPDFTGVFIGTYPFTWILDAIREQFTDYVNLNDTTNYVEVFYVQLANSYRTLYNDSSTQFLEEKVAELDRLYEKFCDELADLFQLRLNIGLNGYEEGHIHSDHLRYIFLSIYKRFILQAKSNFKTILISRFSYLLSRPSEQVSESLLDMWNSLITVLTPMEFLASLGEQNLIDLFHSGQIVGNFLQKYSPKLYQNQHFLMEVVNSALLYQKTLQKIETRIPPIIPPEDALV